MSSDSKPYFSVVIPTFNRVDMLVRVLDSLGGQVGAPRFEVIVINDGSNDATEQKMLDRVATARDSYPIHFESQINAGPGAARNRGVARASGSFVVLIGDDTVPEQHFLAEHARTHSESGNDPLVACLGYTGWPRGAAVTSFMDYINDWGLQFGYRMIRDGATVPFNFFYTSNVSLSTKILTEFPFDTTFPAAAWEDIELAYRLDREGLKIRYNAAAITRHHHPMTIDSFSRRQYVVGKSGAIFYEKYPELGHFLGVHELSERGLEDDATMDRLTRIAKRGERYRLLARKDVFERLMRQHYLRGLRDGLKEMEASRIE